VVDRAGGFDVIRCRACGFSHVIPLPTVQELETTYRHDYYRTDKPHYVARYLEDQPWWNTVYDGRLERMERRLPARRRRLLDVGSGPGLFLLRGQERGWKVLGVEPSEQAAAHTRSLGVDVVNTFLTADTAKGLGRFDAVHASLVLEHIPDPAGFLHLVRGLLRPGGVLCVVTPNDYNPFQRALRDTCGFAPWWVAPPHHLNYFNVRSLKRLAARVGFTPFHVETTFPMDLFLLMGDNYVGDDALGRACHGRRKSFEINMIRHGDRALLTRLYGSLAKLGLGREVVLFCQR
jgi:SAM-dependent methyltransferase